MNQEATPHDEVGYALKRAQHALRGAMDAALGQLGLTTPQYAALAALGAGAASNAELARACFVTPQTMHAIVRGLVDTGLVKRGSHPDHGRIVRVQLTAEGDRALLQADPVVRRIEARMVSGLGEEARRFLRDALREAADRLEEPVERVEGRRAVDEAIVAGYQRVPPTDAEDGWAAQSGRELIAEDPW